MPAKNRTKQYEEDARYHLYNRGVDKQKIFRDRQDHSVFLSYLKTYLEPKDEITLRATIMDETASWRAKGQAIKLLRLNNFYDNLTLLSYCLMPNHFHFLVHQRDEDGIDRFVNSLGTRYTMYFNKKYKRVGPLFQGVYKAVLVKTDDQLLYLSRYIHRNPLGLDKSKILASQGLALRSWEYSSYKEYLALRQTKWVNRKEILTQFGKKGTTSYQSFVEGFDENENAAYILHDTAIDVD
ncbi:MAG: transposase [Candidatus Gottesmanbacteria bacterium]|nr:transposase [Candidatus Gottesmanbacteria bacterium]